jgi:hypothetical protein
MVMHMMARRYSRRDQVLGSGMKKPRRMYDFWSRSVMTGYLELTALTLAVLLVLVLAERYL